MYIVHTPPVFSHFSLIPTCLLVVKRKVKMFDFHKVFFYICLFVASLYKSCPIINIF